MAALQDQLTADMRDAMRAGDSVRRDEIRGLIAMLKSEQQTKLTRTLEQAGLILEDSPDTELSTEQRQQIDDIRANSDLNAEEEQAVLLKRIVQHRQSI